MVSKCQDAMMRKHSILGGKGMKTGKQDGIQKGEVSATVFERQARLSGLSYIRKSGGMDAELVLSISGVSHSDMEALLSAIKGLTPDIRLVIRQP